MFDAASLLASAVVGGIVGAAGTAYKSRKDLEGRYDIALREKRVAAYAELWATLEPLAEYFGAQPTRDEVAELGRAVRTWYFHTGGLVLSESTRAPYFNLQQGLTGVVQSKGSAAEIDGDEYRILKALASRLRTATTDDVATRLPPRLRSRVGAPVRRVVRRAHPLRVTVDRRWKWDKGERSLALFAIVDNRSDTEQQIAGVVLGDHEHGAFRLQPGEDREIDLPAPLTAAQPIAVRVKVRRAGRVGGRTRHPSVPLSSKELDPAPGRATPAQPQR